MARYKDCDKCYHRLACAGDTDKWNYYGECPHYIAAADVAPRSEVAREIFEEINAIKKEYASGDIDGNELYIRLFRLEKKYLEGK